MKKLRLLITIFLLMTMGITASAYADDATLPDPVGRVVWVKGTLKAVMLNKDVRTLQKTSLIYLHDTLVTEGNSSAEIVFTDNSLMTLRPATKFRIDQYAYDPNKRGVSKYITNLMEGGFRTITGAIAKDNPDNYRVNTPVATIGVRGTDYEVIIANGEISVAYYEGKPCVSAGDKTLCLDSATPFASVPVAANAVPMPLKVAPIYFQEKSVITPAAIEPVKMPDVVKPTGPISSFCISQ